MLSEIPEGVTPVYEHCRSYTDPEGTVNPKGGTTFCRLYKQEEPFDDEGKKLEHPGFPLAVGVACCSQEDQYNKARGRAISLGRALKAYNGTTGS